MRPRKRRSPIHKDGVLPRIADAHQLNGSARVLVEVRNLALDFKSRTDTTRALESINLEVATGSLTAIVGPSGCGKSTLLHVLAGLLQPTSGEVIFRGGRRPKIGYMFQQDSLLPWRTALSNVELALRLNGASTAEARSMAAKALQHFGLEGFERHFPRQLSGGMRKRVALACALSYHPDLLLMDEPYSSLDAQTRLLLQDELLTAWKEAGTTIIFVTHDLEEAVCLGDKVVIMSRRPGTILATVPVALPRPRSVMEARGNPRFADSITSLWAILRDQVSLGGSR
jgi:NitT/TauT family transport system ATP-binding protein